MSPDLENLIALHEIDIRLVEFQAQIKALDTECTRIETEYQQYAAAYNEVQSKLTSSHRRNTQLEADLADTQQKLEKYNEDQKRVRNQKEYAATLTEIDNAKKAISRFETQLLELMDEVKRLEDEAAKYSPDIENKRKEADAAIADCRARQQQIKQDMEHIKQERVRCEAAVSRPWMDRYNRVSKLRTGQALSQVINGACSSCRMTLRPQVYSEVRQGDVIYICDHCSRILYYRPEPKVVVMEA